MTVRPVGPLYAVRFVQCRARRWDAVQPWWWLERRPMNLRRCLCLHVRRDHVGNRRGLGWCRARVSPPSVRSKSEETTMSIDHVLAVVPVADFEAAHAWYERVFGRPADNLPMEGLLAEWRVTDSGWVQVTRDRSRRLGAGGPRSDPDGKQGRAAIGHPRSRRQHDHLHRGLPRPVLEARAGEDQPGRATSRSTASSTRPRAGSTPPAAKTMYRTSRRRFGSSARPPTGCCSGG
jgi:hypothetical protein